LRSYAVDCARLARAAAAPEEKARLLNIAQAWIYLAARVERLGGRAKGGPAEAAEAAEAPATPAPDGTAANPEDGRRDA
jgi:hypothetical protein